ncbi:MAG TPA: OmpA family protein [Saprospiraceae bacterium]|nr:OmpA family protein [Saprospiraceae bacterium]
MTNRINYLFFVLLLVVSSVSAQKDATLTTGVADEQTVNAEQNKSWRMGQSSYSAKPKNAWELGVHVGHFFIDGDVDTKFPGGYGLGLHLRKAIHYVFSVRADFMYGSAKGLDPQLWNSGLVEDVYTPYNSVGASWFPSYKTNYGYLAFQGVLNIGNLLFHKDRNKWNWYTAVGVGLSSHSTKLDLLNSNNAIYTGLEAIEAANDFNTKAGRKDIKEAVGNIYDGEYETPSWKKAGIFRLGDETNVHVVFTASMGISRKLSNRFNLGLEHQLNLSDNDALDGIRFRTGLDQSTSNDISHYTNIRLGINLGNFDKVTEPLYWLNPLDAQMNDIAALKQRPILDLTDTDSDGIIDMLDQELDTPAGAPVDTRGIALDSDGDGVADYKDKEPYSPPGYVVDKDGVANFEKLTTSDVNKAIDIKLAAYKASNSDCGKWFLPMIHYDLDKATIKPEFYGHLHHVASVIKMCPDVCVAVVGHTDVRSSNNYNNALSYNRAENAINYLVSQYGIDRSRFKIMYGGEDAPLVSNSKRDKEHYMNRRVEFRLCADGDTEMPRPTGSSNNTSKGVKSTNSSRFIGNKNSGY